MYTGRASWQLWQRDGLDLVKRLNFFRCLAKLAGVKHDLGIYTRQDGGRVALLPTNEKCRLKLGLPMCSVLETDLRSNLGRGE